MVRCCLANGIIQVAYRSFARKHEMTKANLRRKTALLRVLESRLDKREDALHELHERSQEEVFLLLRKNICRSTYLQFVTRVSYGKNEIGVRFRNDCFFLCLR